MLVDSTESRLLSLARSYKTAPCSTALRPVLPGVDAVVVATPPSTHVTVALEAIHAGKHVLVEKPLAPTAEGARRLIAAAADAGVALMVGHTFEYNPAVRKLRELVQGQQLGELFYVDSARLNLGLYQNDVNVIIDLAPHDISIINHVLGRTPVAVQAWAARHAHRRFEDVAYLRLFYDDFSTDAACPPTSTLAGWIPARCGGSPRLAARRWPCMTTSPPRNGFGSSTRGSASRRTGTT